MVDDNSGCGLLRIEHEFIGQFDADPLRFEQLKELRLVLDIRTRRVTKAVP